MKKLFTSMLALAAIAGLAPTASAQDEEPMLQFYVHGQPVKNGDRIDITPYYEAGLSQYNPELTCMTTATDEMSVTLDFYKNETPALDADWEYGAKVNAMICWPSQCQMVGLGKSLTVSGDMYADEAVDMQVHLGLELGDYQEYDELSVKAEFSLTAQFDEEEVKLIFFVDKPSAGVEGIEADSDAAPVYYDLQGRQVANPSNGLYIVKKGSKVTKAFIR